MRKIDRHSPWTVCWLAIIIATCSLLAQSTKAGDKILRKGGVGLKAGAIMMGKMDVQIVEYDPKIAVTWGVFFDIPINSSNYFSLAADFYDFEVVDASVIAIDVSLGYKASLYNSQSRVAFRPGLAVGLAYLADPGLVPGGNVLDPQDSVRLDPPQTLGATSYLTIKLFAEAIFISNNTSTFLLDGGFFFAPVGGNHLYDVTVAPSLYLRVGIAY